MMNDQTYLAWVVIIFLMDISTYSLAAQVPNGAIYEELIDTYFSEHGNRYQQVQGQPIKNWMPEYELDSLSLKRLMISPVIVKYERLGKKSYVRMISVRLSVQDSVVTSSNPTYRDTLDKKSFKKIFRESPHEFRADNPSILSKWIIPSALISGSVAGVVALFFVRSR